MTPTRYTDEELFQLARDLDRRYPDGLTLDAFCRETGVGHTTVQRRFGGWLALRTAAGLARRKSHLINGRTHSRDEFVTKLKAAVSRYGKFITQHEFCTWMGVCPNTLHTYCGSWRKLRAMAGLPERRLRQRLYSRFELLSELGRLRAELKHWPTAEEINRHGRFSYATYAENFGGMRKLRREYEAFAAACRAEIERRKMQRETASV